METTTIVVPSFGMDSVIGRPVRTVNGKWQTRKDGTFIRAARNYRITDPTALAAKLEGSGFAVTKARTLFGHAAADRGDAWKRTPWKVGLEVTYPATTTDRLPGSTYTPRARILCAHTGRHALIMAYGELRLECTNQFTNGEVHVRHCDPEIDRIMEDPARVLWDLLERQGRFGGKIEALRGIGLASDYVTAIQANSERLYQAYRRGIRETDRELGYQGWPATDPWIQDSWRHLQGLTRSRYPTLLRAASILVQARDRIINGERVEEYFDLLAPKN